jgi:deoxyribonucleoside regulator
MLQAPGVVDNHQTQQLFMADAQVQQVFELANNASMAFLGIGAIGDDTLWGRAGLLSKSITAELESLGAVGDIMSRFFDQNGNLVNSSLCQRVVGIPIQQLLGINRRVGVAGGKNKFEAIKGALHGGYINVLITDHITAQKLESSFTKQDQSSVERR